MAENYAPPDSIIWTGQNFKEMVKFCGEHYMTAEFRREIHGVVAYLRKETKLSEVIGFVNPDGVVDVNRPPQEWGEGVEEGPEAWKGRE